MTRTKPRRLSRDDLLGSTAISYLRWSSDQQESGSTIKRQQETLTRVRDHFQLNIDQELIDKGLSASKAIHRTKGQFSDLLKAIALKVIPRGTVLIIEAIDRLFREGPMDVFPILKDMVVTGGIIIVTGDLSIWGEFEINDIGLSHKLLAEINGAAAYTRRLAEMAAGAHSDKRARYSAGADDPDAKLPIHNCRPPGWIIRINPERKHATHEDYVLHPQHVETLREIFNLYRAGNTCTTIAAMLNARGVPQMGIPKGTRLEWRGPRIGAILRNEAVLGFFQPATREGTKHIPVGRKIKVYPEAIDAATWMAVQEMMDARQGFMKGKKGAAGPINLFRGKAFCGTCGGALRVDTGGRLSRRGTTRVRKLFCARHAESKTCADTTRYDLTGMERDLLFAILSLSELAPRVIQQPDQDAAATLAALQVEIDMLQQSITTLAPKIGLAAALADQVMKMSIDLDEKRRHADALLIAQQAAVSSGTRRDEVFAFIRRLITPAMQGDVTAREQLFGLLGRIDFRIVGGSPPGALEITCNGHTETVMPVAVARTFDDAA